MNTQNKLKFAIWTRVILLQITISLHENLKNEQ